MRILHFIPTFSSGGAEAFIMNLADNIDRNKYQTELLAIDAVNGIYDDRTKKSGIKLNVLIERPISDPIKRYLKAYREFERFMERNKGRYDVIHFNIAQGEELPFIHTAKKAGVPLLILHSHNSSVNSRLKYIGHVLCKKIYRNDADIYLACSDMAAAWLVPERKFKNKDYRIIKNGIDTERFRFCKVRAQAKRHELGIGSQPVFINIGRLDKQKNHTFLIDVFQKIVRELPDALLLVAGDGELRRELEEKSYGYGLYDSIKWLGKRTDISGLLSAADVFLLPSLFEGLPYTVIEAQCSGIRCVISYTISEECIITDLVTRSPLDAGEYAERAVAAYCKKVNDRSVYAGIVRDAGFDIKDTAADIIKIYGR